jgi:deazaflavin-dependent oxidoreductase (nitroreductase family)
MAGLRRTLFRLPLTVERVAGWHLQRWLTRLTGVDWIVLETVGRRSGRPHVVVVDIVGSAAAGRVVYVQPADGRRAAWVRNVVARPDIWVRIDGRRAPARVRDATGAEGAAVVLRFLRAHPWYGRVVVWFVGYVRDVGRPDDALLRDLASTPVFAIELGSK